MAPKSSRPLSHACEVLGVSRLASQQEIRDAWRRLAFLYHPDRPGGSAEKFKAVNDAYRTLRSSDARPDHPPKPGATARPKGSGTRTQRRRTPREPEFFVEEPQPKPQPKWKHPKIRTSLLKVSRQFAEACRAELQRYRETTPPATLSPEAAMVSGHVPAAVRRTGRRVSYILQAPLSPGINQVALPTGELDGRRSPKVSVINLNSRDGGPSTIEVPSDMRASKFPGARRVRLHFGLSDLS